MLIAAVVTFSAVSVVELCSYAIYPSVWYKILIPHLLTPVWTPPRPCVCAESPSSSEVCERAINNNTSNKCCQRQGAELLQLGWPSCCLHGRRMGRGVRKAGTDAGVQVGSKAGHLQTNSLIQGAGKASRQHRISPCRAARIRYSTRMLLLLRNKRCLALEGSKVRGNFQMLSQEERSTK